MSKEDNMKKVIKNGTVITMDSSRERFKNVDIVIEDQYNCEICENYDGNYDELIDATGKIVMPGLINGHTHLGMSIFRATNDNLNLQDWLNKKIWPIEDNMTDDDLYYTTLLSCIEMIKTGTTTANDMYFGWRGSIRALEESKVRCMYSRCLMGNGDDASIERIQDFMELYHNHKNSPLLSFSLTPHAMYTCSKEYLKKCKQLADDLHLPIHMHFCENKSEVQGIEQDYQKLPVEALEEVGFLENKLILAHGTFISQKEQELLKGKDVSIVTNPVSNLNLGCGIADISSYKKHGINVCLGTDGQGSGNNLNLFYHMSVTDQLQKALYQDPTVFSSYDVLKLTTVNGAKALGLEDKIGSIEVGKLADIIILDYSDIETYPTVDLITQIVHNTESKHMDTTMINGEILMKNHQLLLPIDEEELKRKIDSIIERLSKKV